MLGARRAAAAAGVAASAPRRAAVAAVASAGRVRWASSEYAKLKIYKNNYVEMNEVLRENKFTHYTPNKTNIVGLVVCLVAFPLFFHGLTKHEAERRDRVIHNTKREYL